MAFNARGSVLQEILKMGLTGRKTFPVPDNLTMLVHYERLRKKAPRRLRKLEERITDHMLMDRWSDLAYELAGLIGIDPADLVIYISRRQGTTLRLSE